ncbi:MAG: glycosyltransferase family 39 protein [bacterium]|nr:glycosyltransferase family 39 protein [bacterium]
MRNHGPLVGILLLAAALNFYGLNWGVSSLEGFRLDGRRISFAQAGFHPDSNALERATASLSRSMYPSIERDGETYLFSTYGPVFMYLYQGIARAGGFLFGFTPFGTDAPDSDATRIAGRVLSALAGLLSVWLTFLLGRRCFGRAAGLLAGFLLAVMPMNIQAAHMATVDGLLAAGVAWVCLQSVLIFKKGRRRDYVLAGLALGISVAVKLNAALLAVAPALAHLLHVFHIHREAGIPSRLRYALFSRRIWMAAGYSLGVYLVFTPAAVFRFQDYFLTSFYGNIFHVFWLNITGAHSEMITYVQRGSLYLENAPTYLYHLTDVFPGGLGWPLEIVVLLGCFYGFYRRSPEALILAVTVFVYFLLIGRLWDKPIRYFVLVGPLFAVLSGRMLADGILSVWKTVRGVSIAVACLLCLYSLVYAAAFANLYAAPDSRVQAALWVQEHIPEQGVIVLERGHNNLASLVSSTHSVKRMDIEQEMYNTPHEDLAKNGDYVACFETGYLSQADYLVLSDDRMALAASKPTAEHYYRALFDGKLGYELVESFEMRPHLWGVRFDDSDTDLNLRRYDHPSTYVFRRAGAASLYAERPDLNIYRLQSREDCLEVFNRAIQRADYTLFRHVLPRRIADTLPGESQMDFFRQFLTQPQLVEKIRSNNAFAEENGFWRINVQVKNNL